jgi:hypothetical protein
MRSVILITIVTGSLWAQSTDAALAVLAQRRGGASAAEVHALTSGLAYDTRQYGDGPEGYSARMARSARTLGYLNGMRNVAGMDLALGLALADAYQNVALMQMAGSDPRYFDRNGALLTYQGSLMLLNQLYGRYPNDPRLTGQIGLIAGRIRALGGTLPVWINLPFGGAPAPSTGIPAPEIPVARSQAPKFEMPKLDWAQVPANQRDACRDSLDRYLNAAASAQGALSVMDSIRISVESRGLSLRGDYISGAARLTDRLQSARESLEKMDCPKADEWLGMAEGETKRLMKDLGQ